MDVRELIKQVGFPEEFAGCLIFQDLNLVEKYLDYLEKKGIKIWYDEKKEFVYKNKKIKLPYDKTIYIKFPDNFKEKYPIEIIFLSEILQRVNVIIDIGKNSEILFYSGCVGVKRAKHRDKTILILRENSELKNVKLHSWINAEYKEPNVIFDGIYFLEKNSKLRNFYFTYNFNDYYISRIKVYMKNAYLEDYVYTHQIGGKFISSIKVYMKNSKAKLITKNVSLEGITITKNFVYAFGNSYSYSSCDGISTKGKIQSIPSVFSKGNNQLYHEASIGKINEEVLEYFMARGLNEDEAKNLYILGFLTKEIPDFLSENIKFIIKGLIQ